MCEDVAIGATLVNRRPDTGAPPAGCVSPGSGRASGCRKYTGKSMEAGIDSPFNFAGTKRSADDPLAAAESSAAFPLGSSTRVDSGATRPSRSMNSRRVTFPCTFCA